MLSFIAQLSGSHDVTFLIWPSTAAPSLAQASEYHTQDITWIVIVPMAAYFNARISAVFVPNSFSLAPKNVRKKKRKIKLMSKKGEEVDLISKSYAWTWDKLSIL